MKFLNFIMNLETVFWYYRGGVGGGGRRTRHVPLSVFQNIPKPLFDRLPRQPVAVEGFSKGVVQGEGRGEGGGVSTPGKFITPEPT